ncbi:Uncharacterized protein APZ42_023087 [Daphnia magna]|uniref:Uncharacterized protein n=1 Tax=Daphnia magna TaxID=35525 RepID=A0A164V8G4_9CRUS|nr:Uncharacterized protein APZ42_023087 [Daphnia magna]
MLMVNNIFVRLLVRERGNIKKLSVPLPFRSSAVHFGDGVGGEMDLFVFAKKVHSTWKLSNAKTPGNAAKHVFFCAFASHHFPMQK